MPRHKKITRNEVARIERWLAEDYIQARQERGQRIWNPQVDTICKWNIYTEPNNRGQQVVTIKRFIKFRNGGSTWQRLKRAFYRDYLNSKRELENLVIYLNGLDPAEYRAGIKYKLKESYIPRTHVLKFCRMTRDNFLNEDKKDIENRIQAFVSYGLNWFQERTEKVNDWKRHEKRWGQCLINMSNDIRQRERIFPQNELRCKNTIVRVIWLMNQFMEYLHSQYPHKYPLTSFNPITKSQFRSLLRERRRRGMVNERGHINEVDWARIRQVIRADNKLKIIELCYEFGLRRSEALALSVDKMYRDHIYINEQLWKIDYDTNQPVMKPTKNGEPRRIPYGVSRGGLTANQIAEIIDTSQRISPNQLTKKWREAMNRLGLDYDIHDCRHSFCRYIVNNRPLQTAMEYTGHKSIETLNGYLQSKTEYSTERFTREQLGLVG